MVDTDLSPFVTNTYNEFALSDTTSASTMVGENFPFCIMGAAAKVYFLGTGHTYTFEPTYECKNDYSWVDVAGDNCDWYETDDNSDECGDYGDGAYTACCVCGGGSAYEFEYTAEGRFPSEAPTASDEPLSSGVYKICHTDYWGAERCTGT